MMRAMMKRLNERKLWTMANGVMDGVRTGAIVAVVAYGVALSVKFFSGFRLAAWLNDCSLDNILTMIMFLVTAIAYWEFCDASSFWRGHIYDRLEFEIVFNNGLYLHRTDRDQLRLKAYQDKEKELRPERYFGEECKIYRIMQFSTIFLLVASALALTVGGWLVLKLMLTVMVSGIALFASKCENRLTYGYWS